MKSLKNVNGLEFHLLGRMYLLVAAFPSVTTNLYTFENNILKPSKRCEIKKH